MGKKKRSRVSEDEEIESDTNPFDQNEHTLYQVLYIILILKLRFSSILICTRFWK